MCNLKRICSFTGFRRYTMAENFKNIYRLCDHNHAHFERSVIIRGLQAVMIHLLLSIRPTGGYGHKIWRCNVPKLLRLYRGGFKAESLLGHITRKASSPLPSPPFPPLSSPPPFPLLPFSLPSPFLPSSPFEVGPLKSS